MKIGVMGARGSFSEQAGEHYIATMALAPATLVPLVTAERLLASLTQRDIDRAIFPVMNSTGGIVVEAVHAMGKHLFTIDTMFDMDIHHMLLAHKNAAVDSITTITSHVQALRQRALYLEREWLGAEIVPYIDTATAAADVASGVLPPTTAVIAPRRAAELHDLAILAELIQDNPHNKTTFVVASSAV